MTTVATTLDANAAVFTTGTAPVAGNINSYDAHSSAITATLPALSGLTVGASCLLEKYQGDTSYNAVTINRSGSDLFDDGSTQVILTNPGEQILLEVVEPVSTPMWKIVSRSNYKTGLASRATELTLASSSAATDIISVTLPANTLAVGSTYRIKLYGTIQTQATSGTLTFIPFLQGVAINSGTPFQLATQASALAAAGFCLEVLLTVRSVGATGSAMSHGFGTINAVTNDINLTSTNATATTVNTTNAAALKIQAQWQTPSATNILKVEVATIERVL